MTTALREISCEDLWQKVENGEDFVLVDALAPLSFAAAHLPGAINITPQRVDSLAERRIPDREATVVVYCAGPDCDSSVEVARRLVELGYANVLHFGEGKEGWREAGHPLQGGRA